MRHPAILEEIARHDVTKIGDGEGPVTSPDVSKQIGEAFEQPQTYAVEA